MGQMLWFLRIKDRVSKVTHSSLTDFNDAPYNELQFLTDPALLGTHLQGWCMSRISYTGS